MTSDPLLRLRPEFPSLENCCWLVTHSLGAMPRGAEADLAEYAREWREDGVTAWDRTWWRLPCAAGDELAPLLGAPPGTVVFQPSATFAGAIFLSTQSFAPPRDTLVTTALDFPSLLYLYRGMRERGVRVVEVPSDDGIAIDTERLLAAIDERTRVVALSPVRVRSGFVQDAARVARRAREVGACVVLDLYQSAGCLPIELERLGVDAAFGGCLKWLCGGPGNAFLYVRRDRIEQLRPSLTGWPAHEEPFAFDAGEFRPAQGIERFLCGTPGVSSIRAALAGVRVLKAAGLDEIRAKSLRLTARILERADAEGWRLNTPRDPALRGGTAVIDPPDSGRIAAELIRRGVLVDHRPGAGIRVGPHFYNTEGEVDHALDEIARLVRERSTV
ncbi:MAG: aminotransferase class V-fold PLP-dependent enzyme [Candidatus Eiseniibacteriota bacterium]